MQITKLDHIGIRVMNFKRSISFYEQLGFIVTRNDLDEHVVVMNHSDGVEINLLDSGSDDHSRKNILMDVEKKYPGYTHYALEVPCADEARLFFETIGVDITEGPVTFGDGKTSIFIRDPDLNTIEFTELPKK